jgi:CRISPR-associated protein Csm2
MTYYDDKGNIRAELLTDEAQKQAEAFVPLRFDPKKKREEPTRDAIKNSQLRKFFGEFKNLQRQLEQKRGDEEKREEIFLSLKPMVKMANAKVAYAKARGVVPESFAQWLKKNVTAVDTAKDFTAFMYHFEAIVGFCYERNPRD